MSLSRRQFGFAALAAFLPFGKLLKSRALSQPVSSTSPTSVVIKEKFISRGHMPYENRFDRQTLVACRRPIHYPHDYKAMCYDNIVEGELVFFPTFQIDHYGPVSDEFRSSMNNRYVGCCSLANAQIDKQQSAEIDGLIVAFREKFHNDPKEIIVAVRQDYTSILCPSPGAPDRIVTFRDIGIIAFGKVVK